MHTLTAVNILLAVTSHPIKNSTFIPFFTSTTSLQTIIRHGFVESLEAEENQVCKQSIKRVSDVYLLANDATKLYSQCCEKLKKEQNTHYIPIWQKKS